MDSRLEITLQGKLYSYTLYSYRPFEHYGPLSVREDCSYIGLEIIIYYLFLFLHTNTTLWLETRAIK